MFQVVEIGVKGENRSPRRWAPSYAERNEAIAAIEKHLKKFEASGYDEKMTPGGAAARQTSSIIDTFISKARRRLHSEMKPTIDK